MISTLTTIGPVAPTINEMQERINLLSDEMTANEQENAFMQMEIDELDAKIDVIKANIVKATFKRKAK